MSDITTKPSNDSTPSERLVPETPQSTPAGPQPQPITPQPQQGFSGPEQGQSGPQPTPVQPNQGYVAPAPPNPPANPHQGYVPQQQGYTAPQPGQTQTPQGYAPPQQPQPTYNPQQGYTPQQQPDYVPQTQPGYTPQQQGYGPQSQPGYAPPQQSGYAHHQQQSGYGPPPQPGYAPQQPPPPPGYTPQQQSGYAPQQPPPPPGYEHQSNTGFAPQPPPPPPGYAPQGAYVPQPSYVPQPGYAPPQPQVSGAAGPVYPVLDNQGNPQNPWMPKPETTPDCPPGLEYLTLIDQILVKQKAEVLETLTDIETQNKYKLVNNAGQQVYFATEETETCLRQVCGSVRGFVMHIVDNHGQEVMRVTRDFKCSAGCCWCICCKACALEVIIEAPLGQVIGKVKQTCSFLRPYFHITNAEDEVILKIRGPIAQVPFCVAGQDFQVLDPEKNTTVGKISKERTGLMKEVFTRADNFGVTFPMNLDVKSKAAMIGAVFLIDLMYFERQFQLNREQTQAAATAASTAAPARSLFSFFSRNTERSS